MKSLAVLVLLSSAVLLSGAAPPLEPVTCSEDDGAAAARLAVHHINEHHHHGYKFKLSEVQGTKVEQEVMANCTVMMSVDAVGAKVKEYKCDTRTVKNSMELAEICPDCPILVPLNNAQGLSSVHKAVKEFNQNTSNQHYYILREVGRLQSGRLSPGSELGCPCVDRTPLLLVLVSGSPYAGPHMHMAMGPLPMLVLVDPHHMHMAMAMAIAMGPLPMLVLVDPRHMLTAMAHLPMLVLEDPHHMLKVTGPLPMLEFPHLIISAVGT
ncbi:hypothetical protein INR49_008577 [Caranx melampygus]|nr:hypothetical protein INR49_008577 [Caranx melampygus]